VTKPKARWWWYAIAIVIFGHVSLLGIVIVLVYVEAGVWNRM